MPEVTMALVRELREKSGAGVMDCKTALTESGGDVEAAVDWLRKQGLAAAARKAGRIAAEGLVAVAVGGGRGVAVELNSETDFVARNGDFQSFVGDVATAALEAGGGLEATAAAALPDGRTVGEAIAEMVGSIGENLTLRRVGGLSVGKGVVSSYVHAAVAPGMGRIGVLVGLESDAGGDALDGFGRKLAMHVAAASPSWLSRGDVAAEDLARERSVLAEQARASGKPPDIVEKMVEGRLRKYYEEACLLDQAWALGGEIRVSEAVAAAAEELGAEIQVAGMVRLQLGEGVEKARADFAADVAATAGG